MRNPKLKQFIHTESKKNMELESETIQNIETEKPVNLLEEEKKPKQDKEE